MRLLSITRELAHVGNSLPQGSRRCGSSRPCLHGYGRHSGKSLPPDRGGGPQWRTARGISRGVHSRLSLLGPLPAPHHIDALHQSASSASDECPRSCNGTPYACGPQRRYLCGHRHPAKRTARCSTQTSSSAPEERSSAGIGSWSLLWQKNWYGLTGTEKDCGCTIPILGYSEP